MRCRRRNGAGDPEGWSPALIGLKRKQKKDLERNKRTKPTAKKNDRRRLLGFDFVVEESPSRSSASPVLETILDDRCVVIRFRVFLLFSFAAFASSSAPFRHRFDGQPPAGRFREKLRAVALLAPVALHSIDKKCKENV